MHLRLDVEQYVIDYALKKHHRLRPKDGRRSGIPDPPGTRGKGDFLDLVATETLQNYFHDQGKQVGAYTVCGRGDGGIDMLLWEQLPDILQEQVLGVNIKTSDTAMRPGLHLIVKGEELLKPLPHLFIQCIMRVGRPDPDNSERVIPSLDEDLRPMSPHLFVLGYARRTGPEWAHLVEGEIENTDDRHKGGRILDEHLRPIADLVKGLKNSL
jgi:hypothetical protein